MRVELYERLMEAQERIAQALYTRGVAHNDVLAAFDTADERLSEDQRSEDPYLAALAIYAESLGGRIEVRAVFGDEEIVVLGDPSDTRITRLNRPIRMASTCSIAC